MADMALLTLLTKKGINFARARDLRLRFVRAK